MCVDISDSPNSSDGGGYRCRSVVGRNARGNLYIGTYPHYLLYRKWVEHIINAETIRGSGFHAEGVSSTTSRGGGGDDGFGGDLLAGRSFLFVSPPRGRLINRGSCE